MNYSDQLLSSEEASTLQEKERHYKSIRTLLSSVIGGAAFSVFLIPQISQDRHAFLGGMIVTGIGLIGEGINELVYAHQEEQVFTLPEDFMLWEEEHAAE